MPTRNTSSPVTSPVLHNNHSLSDTIATTPAEPTSPVELPSPPAEEGEGKNNDNVDDASDVKHPIGQPALKSTMEGLPTLPNASKAPLRAPRAKRLDVQPSGLIVAPQPPPADSPVVIINSETTHPGHTKQPLIPFKMAREALMPKRGGFFLLYQSTRFQHLGTHLQAICSIRNNILNRVVR